MKCSTMVLNEERKVTLTSYLQDLEDEYTNIPRRPAVLILPGGAYVACADREADPVAQAYLKAGYQAFILRYSIKQHAEWPNPLKDYEQAIQLIRDRAEEWKVYPDRIAVVGFSAGGHLAACAAVHSEIKPNAAILGYAVTRGEFIKETLASAPDVVGSVDASTCPCFVFATRTDTEVPINNSIDFIQALAKEGVPFESHIYGYGPHGFSTADSSLLKPGTVICNRVHRWVSDSVEWLKDIWGDFGDGEMTAPRCAGEKGNLRL